MKTKTDAIFSTALAYATYKSISNNIDDNLLKNMFNDLCLLCDEYGFDYRQELKQIDTTLIEKILRERQSKQ